MKFSNLFFYWKKGLLSLGLLCILSTNTSFAESVSEGGMEFLFRHSALTTFITLPPDTSHANIDGPHIFYKPGYTVIKQVLKNDKEFYAVMDTITGSIKGRRISCHVNDTLHFSTTIKKELPKNEPNTYAAPEKILAISDIEGNFIAFRDMLISNLVMNADYQWIFGTGHLVLNGDFFDRGLHVTECLWLIYHLEQEALNAGGYVHFILGNHELMNMNEDLAYVRNKYFENTWLIKDAYKDWYTPDTELGRWLRTKNIVEKIGDYLFTHGGISEAIYVCNQNLNKTNSVARDYYYKEVKARESKDKFVATLFSPDDSPFWYRGYVNQTMDEDTLDLIMARYEVKRIVVGHSLVKDVSYLYNRKVIAIDTKHADGDSEGLLVESDTEYRVDSTGKRFTIN